VLLAGRNTNDVSGACYSSASTSTDTVSSLWWLMLLLLVVVPVPVVVTVVIWKKNVNRQRQVYGMADQRQLEDRTSAYMTDSNN